MLSNSSGYSSHSRKDKGDSREERIHQARATGETRGLWFQFCGTAGCDGEDGGGGITNSELGGAEPVPAGSASNAASRTNQPFPAAADRNLTICSGPRFKNVNLAFRCFHKDRFCADRKTRVKQNKIKSTEIQNLQLIVISSPGCILLIFRTYRV